MNAEHYQQLYGGEISDFIKPNKPVIENTTNFSTSNLEGIYNNQVQPKGSLNTNGISSVGFNPSSLIERDGQDELSMSLAATLNRVAQEIDLQSDNQPVPSASSTLTLQSQTNADIQTAQDNVLKAIEELRALNEL
jgi:hypothetical protein